MTGKEYLATIVENLEDEKSLTSRFIHFKWLNFDEEMWTLSLGMKFIGQMEPWIKDTADCVVCPCGENGCHYHLEDKKCLKPWSSSHARSDCKYNTLDNF